jgi:hypothetical protein
MLGRAKDAIGEWHDWEELLRMAAESLRHGKCRSLTRKLKQTAAKKFVSALLLANRMRESCFQPEKTKSKSRGKAAASVSSVARTAASRLA